MDTSKSDQQKPVSTSEHHSVQAELHRTRALLRELLGALLQDGYELYRDSAMSEWHNEDMRRPKAEA
jgi:hypothetical protein